MKKLFLMRHAKSSWKDSDLKDNERPLKKRGEKDAKAMGKLLKSKKHIPDVIISSSAERAKQTAKILKGTVSYKGKVTYSDNLYMAEVKNFFDELREMKGKNKNILIVGHNPGMEAFLQTLTGKVETLPTASIAYLSIPIDDWAELNSEVEAKLKKLWRPKDLK